jgi:cephalosporin hydroxylase
MKTLAEVAVERGYARHMYQHRSEITRFAEWCSKREVRSVIEIGTHCGGTAALFCTLASDFVLSVDLPDGPWGGVSHVAAQMRNRELRNEYPHFYAILGDSHDEVTVDAVAETLNLAHAGKGVDLLFIDGDHSRRGVEQDYQMYKGFVRPGGYIGFHDIKDTPEHRRVRCEVSDFWDALVASIRVDRDDADIRSATTFILPEGEWGGIGVVELR